MNIAVVEKDIIKNTGATFTPKKLADFLSDRILSYYNSDGSISVLDPSCGDGELLVSISNKLSKRQSTFNLYGNDSNESYIQTAKERLKVFDASSNFICGDFLELTQLSGTGPLYQELFP